MLRATNQDLARRRTYNCARPLVDLENQMQLGCGLAETLILPLRVGEKPAFQKRPSASEMSVSHY
jgi:hypothetical protein